jgi:tripartite ATP-independent transporter DctP family solute receptor
MRTLRFIGMVTSRIALIVGGVFLASCRGAPGSSSVPSASAASAEAETVIRLAHGLDPTHPVHQAMEVMGRKLDSLSGGQMALKIYPSEQLGTERQALELLQIGSLDMTKVSSAVMESFSLSYKVLGLPYIFRGEEHRFNVLEGEIGKRILLSSRDVWLRGIVYYDAGSRSFYTKNTPIREPSDLEGLKIRTQSSPVAIRMVRQLGGSPTPIAFGELYTALQQGVVAGAENNPPSFHTTRHYELCQYYSLDRHTAVPDVLVASTHLWDRLSEKERGWLMKAARMSAEVQKTLWDKATKKAMREVKKAGVEIIRPDTEKFAEAVEPLYETYREEAPVVYELLQEIRSVGADSAATNDSAATDTAGVADMRSERQAESNGGKRP